MNKKGVYIVSALLVFTLLFFIKPLRHRLESNKISGSTIQQVDNSLKKVRRNMSTQDRHAFDVAFGLLRQLKAGEGDEAFIQAINGLSTDEVVEMARQEVNKKIAAGDPEFKKFSSWDDMLVKKAEEDAPKRPANAPPPTPLRTSERPGRGD